MSQSSPAAVSKTVRFKRVLLKVSGEALMGPGQYGIDYDTVRRIAEEVRDARDLGVEISLVVGGGNIFRGAGLAEAGMDRVAGDQMGMLATIMNGLALQDALERHGRFCRVMSAIKINQVCEDFIRRRAVRHLEKGRIVVLVGGTGNPFFTTDTAASLRAIEVNADLMLKATKVDGVYDADPVKNPSARRYERLTYDEVLTQRLGVMDATAIVMCRDHGIPLRIFNIYDEGELMHIVLGEPIGTLVEKG